MSAPQVSDNRTAEPDALMMIHVQITAYRKDLYPSLPPYSESGLAFFLQSRDSSKVQQEGWTVMKVMIRDAQVSGVIISLVAGSW